MSPIISVIIPVYNVEMHLKKCLDSVLGQTLNDIEVIAINDGSTDNSLNILQQYSSKDARLKVINQPNQGVSAARNRGMKYAKGEYLGFIDSDDYIELKMYEELYKYAKKYGCDIVVTNVLDEDMNDSKVSLNFVEGFTAINHDQMDDFLKDHFFQFGHAVWNKIFKRRLIEDNHILFHDYREVSSEDMLFNLSVVSCASNMYYLNQPFYHYVLHQNSLTKSQQAMSNMTERCKQTITLVDHYYKDKLIEIPMFIEYLTYTELLKGVAHTTYEAKSIKNTITLYSQLESFQKTLRRQVLSNDLSSYFMNEKGHYSKLYQGFDRVFSLLCLSKCYTLASYLHLLRLKRAQKIVKES